ncbi:hypothetical protein NDU88_006558 [Pleurodeles waltl]|uniref:Reverse transcriptase domain-containing protein n=1 Tax=Pleurodeles waltl TaxID=8319 RepID=A0AAV7VN28_PLEWA|nr:hypothetical protein NDU88_006558 [Pleurodeles waltl]
MLFALYIDPLLWKLEPNRLIAPVQFKDWDTRVLVFVDNVAIVTYDPGTALKEIEKEALAFGEFSGYSLNQDKNQVVISKSVELYNTRVVEKATYLDVIIASYLDRLVEVDIALVIEKPKFDFLAQRLLFFRPTTLEFECHWFQVIDQTGWQIYMEIR